MNGQIEGTPVTVGVGSGLTGPGYSFMLSTDTAGIVWEAILNAGAVPMGAAAWEQLRVWHGTKSINISNRKAILLKFFSSLVKIEGAFCISFPI